MAEDAILLPGTEMEIIEKYPDSRRLDHPNFGDVCRTVYAKGVISDFEKIQDGPPGIRSRVKVKIDGVESDEYVPIFFHQKAQYWDDDDALATDFNDEEQYFERAWMSFQATDGVVVMLQAVEGDTELKPVAVLGFADGVPRIGELILQIYCSATHGYYTSSVTLDPVTRMRHFKIKSTEKDGGWPTYYYGAENEDMQGPDDMSLKLDKEITHINSGHRNFFFEIAPDYPGSNTQEYDWFYYKFLVPVGPFLIIIQVMYHILESYFNYIFSTRHCAVQGFRIQTILNTPENIALASVMQYSMGERITFYGWDPYASDNPIWAGAEWDVYDDAHNLAIASAVNGVSSWANNHGTGGNENYQNRPDWGNVVIRVRPHSKEDLIAAEMWPEEETV